MNKKIIKLIIILAVIFANPFQAFAGLPILDKKFSVNVKEAQIARLSITSAPVQLNLITYKPLALEERNSLFTNWKKIVRSHKKKSRQ